MSISHFILSRHLTCVLCLGLLVSVTTSCQPSAEFLDSFDVELPTEDESLTEEISIPIEDVVHEEWPRIGRGFHVEYEIKNPSGKQPVVVDLTVEFEGGDSDSKSPEYSDDVKPGPMETVSGKINMYDDPPYAHTLTISLKATGQIKGQVEVSYTFW